MSKGDDVEKQRQEMERALDVAEYRSALAAAAKSNEGLYQPFMDAGLKREAAWKAQRTQQTPAQQAPVQQAPVDTNWSSHPNIPQPHGSGTSPTPKVIRTR